jgi:hypothetical protein
MQPRPRKKQHKSAIRLLYSQFHPTVDTGKAGR